MHTEEIDSIKQMKKAARRRPNVVLRLTSMEIWELDTQLRTYIERYLKPEEERLTPLARKRQDEGFIDSDEAQMLDSIQTDIKFIQWFMRYLQKNLTQHLKRIETVEE
jgi:hypothetical protein